MMFVVWGNVAVYSRWAQHAAPQHH